MNPEQSNNLKNATDNADGINSRRTSEQGVQETSHSRPEDRRCLKDSGIPCHSVREDIDGYKLRKQRSSSWGIERAHHPEEDQHCVDEFHIARLGARDHDQQRGAEGESGVADEQDLLPVESVRGMTGKQKQKDIGQELG